MERSFKGKNNLVFEEQIRRQKEAFKDAEELRLENLKEELLRIEREYEGISLKTGKEFETERDDKIWRLIEVMENEKAKMNEAFEKELQQKEEQLEKQLYNKEQVLLAKLRDIEKGKKLNIKYLSDICIFNNG